MIRAVQGYTCGKLIGYMGINLIMLNRLLQVQSPKIWLVRGLVKFVPAR